MTFIPEFTFLVGLLFIFVFGLISQRHTITHMFCILWCFLVAAFLLGRWSGLTPVGADLAKCAVSVLTGLVLLSVRMPMFEASIMLPFALIGQHFLIASQDTICFYAGLELPNFAAVVLSALHSRSGFSVEAALLYLLQSAFSSGLLLLGTSLLYVQSGHIDWQSLILCLKDSNDTQSPGFWLFTLGLVWKIGSAPVHQWVVSVYQSVWTVAAFYISTVPKLAVFWVWQPVCAGVGWLSAVALAVGAIGALGQPMGKPLLAYSAISMNGLWLLSLDTQESTALWVGLTFYLWTLALVWPLLADPFLLCTTDTVRGLCWILVAATLAGLPPFVVFIGKATVLLAAGLKFAPLLGIALFSSVLSVIYYLYLVLLSGFADVGNILYKTPNQSIPFHGCMTSPTVHASLLVGAVAVFWKLVGLRFKMQN